MPPLWSPGLALHRPEACNGAVVDGGGSSHAVVAVHALNCRFTPPIGHDRRMTDDTQQTHPLYAIDRDQIDAVLGHEGEPSLQQRQPLPRYFRDMRIIGAEDIRDDLQKCLTLWGLRVTNEPKTRGIWESGWRPGQENVAEGVGSGADVEDAKLENCLHGRFLGVKEESEMRLDWCCLIAGHPNSEATSDGNTA